MGPTLLLLELPTGATSKIVLVVHSGNRKAALPLLSLPLSGAQYWFTKGTVYFFSAEVTSMLTEFITWKVLRGSHMEGRETAVQLSGNRNDWKSTSANLDWKKKKKVMSSWQRTVCLSQTAHGVRVCVCNQGTRDVLLPFHTNFCIPAWGNSLSTTQCALLPL